MAHSTKKFTVTKVAWFTICPTYYFSIWHSGAQCYYHNRLAGLKAIIHTQSLDGLQKHNFHTKFCGNPVSW